MKIVLDNLTKRFPNRDKKIGGEITAVSHFDLEVPDGKLVGLLGPSGCGKSTALNMICGLEIPTEGKVFFGGDDVTNLPPENRGVGMVFQSYALYPHLTVRENIRFPLENLRGAAKLSKQVMNEKVEEAAKLVQISHLLERRPGEISGGQQQRVAIARALVKLPRVLLLDEPLSNLDARLRLATREEIRRIQTETGITTVFVTHDQEEAMSISDLIVLMKAGVKQQVGKPQEVYEDPANLFVAKFLGTPAINVFKGEVIDGNLWIGEENVLPVPGVKDCKVYAGIRPEGFIPDENGPFSADVIRIEVLGRDTSVVASHPCLDGETVRAIVSSDYNVPDGKSVHFSLKPKCVHLFDQESEERIRYERKDGKKL